jgi:hypothetical protein
VAAIVDATGKDAAEKVTDTSLKTRYAAGKFMVAGASRWRNPEEDLPAPAGEFCVEGVGPVVCGGQDAG